MREIISISTPSVLEFDSVGGETLYGANQEWYKRIWQRKAGCGPTIGASLLWYLACTRSECAGLVPEAREYLRDVATELPVKTPTDARVDTHKTKKEAMLAHMKMVWRYVRPGAHGVNRPDMFVDGVLRFGTDRGISLVADVLYVPPEKGERPKDPEVADFFRKALAKDLPVAFLNLGRGAEKRLESWHWVAIMAFCPETMVCWCYDQGVRRELDLALWMKTSPRGGGFVTIACQTESAGSVFPVNS